MTELANFTDAKKWIDDNKSSLSDLPHVQQLNLYAYFKQSQVGDNNKPKPWAWEIAECHKWESWASLKGMTNEKAAEKYVKLANRVRADKKQ